MAYVGSRVKGIRKSVPILKVGGPAPPTLVRIMVFFLHTEGFGKRIFGRSADTMVFINQYNTIQGVKAKSAHLYYIVM